MKFFDGSIKEVNKEDIEMLNKYIQKNNRIGVVTQGDEARVSVVNSLDASTIEKPYIMSHLSSNKVQNILKNSNVELLFHDYDTMLIISGEAKLIDALEVKQNLFEPWMNLYLKDGYKDKEYALVEIVPKKVRFFI